MSNSGFKSQQNILPLHVKSDTGLAFTAYARPGVTKFIDLKHQISGILANNKIKVTGHDLQLSEKTELKENNKAIQLQDNNVIKIDQNPNILIYLTPSKSRETAREKLRPLKIKLNDGRIAIATVEPGVTRLIDLKHHITGLIQTWPVLLVEDLHIKFNNNELVDSHVIDMDDIQCTDIRLSACTKKPSAVPHHKPRKTIIAIKEDKQAISSTFLIQAGLSGALTSLVSGVVYCANNVTATGTIANGMNAGIFLFACAMGGFTVFLTLAYMINYCKQPNPGFFSKSTGAIDSPYQSRENPSLSI